MRTTLKQKMSRFNRAADHKFSLDDKSRSKDRESRQNSNEKSGVIIEHQGKVLPPQITKIISNLNKRYPNTGDVRKSLPPPISIGQHYCPAITSIRSDSNSNSNSKINLKEQKQMSFTSSIQFQRLRTHETAVEHDLS